MWSPSSDAIRGSLQGPRALGITSMFTSLAARSRECIHPRRARYLAHSLRLIRCGMFPAFESRFNQPVDQDWCSDLALDACRPGWTMCEPPAAALAAPQSIGGLGTLEVSPDDVDTVDVRPSGPPSVRLGVHSGCHVREGVMLVLWTSRGAGSSVVWSRSSSAWPSGGLHSSSSPQASCFWSLA